MQNQLGLVVLAFCGAAILLMLLGAFMYLQYRRFMGRFLFFGVINKVIADTKEDIASEGEDGEDPHVEHHSRAEIRARAASLDFDQAVARYAHKDGPPAQAQGAPEPPPLKDQPKPDSSQPGAPKLRPGSAKGTDEIYDDD